MENVDNKIEELSKMANLDKLGVPEAIIMMGLGLAVLMFGYRVRVLSLPCWKAMASALTTYPTFISIPPAASSSAAPTATPA